MKRMMQSMKTGYCFSSQSDDRSTPRVGIAGDGAGPAGRIRRYSDEPGLHPFRVRPADVPRQPELLQASDDLRAGIDLTAEHAVPSTGGVGVVQVVPGLAHRDQCERPDVRRAVPGLERALAEGV